MEVQEREEKRGGLGGGGGGGGEKKAITGPGDLSALGGTQTVRVFGPFRRQTVRCCPNATSATDLPGNSGAAGVAARVTLWHRRRKIGQPRERRTVTLHYQHPY